MARPFWSAVTRGEWNVCAAELRGYLASRILRPRIALLWLLLVAATALIAADGLSELPWRALACALFIAAFRLWDDLADLDFDRLHHPQRVLAKATNLACFHFVLGAMLALLIGWIALWVGGARALSLLLLMVAFWVLYQIDHARPLRRNWRSALVLVKYPVWVLLLAPHPIGARTVLSAMVVFVVLVLDEMRGSGGAVLRPVAVLLVVAIIAWFILQN